MIIQYFKVWLFDELLLILSLETTEWSSLQVRITFSNNFVWRADVGQLPDTHLAALTFPLLQQDKGRNKIGGVGEKKTHKTHWLR